MPREERVKGGQVDSWRAEKRVCRRGVSSLERGSSRVARRRGALMKKREADERPAFVS